MAKATSKTTDKEAPQVDAPVETPTPEAPQVDAPVENDNSAEIELGEITQLDITSNHDLDIKKEFLTPQDEAFSKEIPRLNSRE